MYKSIHKNKQHMIMIISFAIFFSVFTFLNCFVDDQCLGLKLVSDEFNHVFPPSSNSVYLIYIAKLFPTDHEALRRGRSELLILLELVSFIWSL